MYRYEACIKMNILFHSMRSVVWLINEDRETERIQPFI